jgi:hypothetical protein
MVQGHQIEGQTFAPVLGLVQEIRHKSLSVNGLVGLWIKPNATLFLRTKAIRNTCPLGQGTGSRGGPPIGRKKF